MLNEWKGWAMEGTRQTSLERDMVPPKKDHFSSPVNLILILRLCDHMSTNASIMMAPPTQKFPNRPLHNVAKLPA